MRSPRQLFEHRKLRVRASLRKNAKGSPRLSVFRSGKHIYAQVIDDKESKTIVQASTIDKELKGKVKTGANTEAANMVGKLLGKRAVEAGVKEVVFDRGGYIYHGRVKSLADGAREAGLKF